MNLINKVIDEFENLDQNYNPQIRDDFVKKIALTLDKNSCVIDISSGAKPYFKYFSHCNYVSHEFKGNINIIDDFRNEQNKKNHDIYSDIDNIPVDDNTYDLVLCTEVFEHIPEPIKAMKELVRICKKNGKILLTAPFTSGIHQQPYHFYSGFSPYFYKYLKEIYNLQIIDFKSQGDFYLLLNQEINRCFYNELHPNIIQYNEELNTIIKFLNKYLLNMSKLNENTQNYLNNPDTMLEINFPLNQFTIGYCVLFMKM
jgi:SAM-dependent methyltransferase